MGNQKSAMIKWSGEELTFDAVLDSGYEFKFSGNPDEEGGSPMSFLLASAAGCTAMDIIHMLKKKREPIIGLTVEINGVRAESYPQVYTEAEIVYYVQGNVNPKAVEQVIALSQEKYCSVSISLARGGVNIKTRYEIVGE